MQTLHQLEHETVVGLLSLTFHSSNQSDLTSLLLQQLDWSYIRQFIRHHRIDLPVYQNIFAHKIIDIPSDILIHLKATHHRQIYRNLQYVQVLYKLLDLFSTRSISVMPLKGALLSQILFADVAHRTSADIDLLIHADQVPYAVEILGKAGFSLDPMLSTQEIRARLAVHYHITFREPVHGITIELHWRLAGRRQGVTSDPRLLWEDAQFERFLDFTLPIPRRENLILYATLHGTNHAWSKFATLYDFAVLLQVSEQVDWRYLWQRVRELHSYNAFVISLILINQVFKVKYPDSVLSVLNTKASLRKLSEQRQQQLLSGDKPPIFGRTLFVLGTRDTWLDKLLYLATPNPDDLVRFGSSGKPNVLSYVMRPLTFLSRHGQRIAQHLLG